jgi:hypothetical protein
MSAARTSALLPDEIVVGGGQSDRLKTLPPRSRLGNNAAAFLGGFRLWDEAPSAQATALAQHAPPYTPADTPAHPPSTPSTTYKDLS